MDAKTKEDELIKIEDQPYPWLIIMDGANEKQHMFYSITEKRCHPRFIPELQNKYIVCCYRGWFILDRYDSEYCSLFNILTMEKHQLPPFSLSYVYDCIISSPPTDGICRVLFISGRCHKLWSCYVGDSEFVEHHLDLEFDVIMASTNFEGKLYVVTLPDYGLFTADFSDPHLQFSRVIWGEKLGKILPAVNGTDLALVESRGELMFIHRTSFDSEVVDFQFFKADFTNKEWAVVENLGDQAIFLDDYKGFSSQASKFGLKENAVYYVNPRDRSLYIYDVEDRSISMSWPCPTVDFESSLFWASFPPNDQE